MMSNLRQRGVDDGKLRHNVRTRFGTINRKYRINESNMGGRVKFEFKRAYKSQVALHQTTLGVLRIKLLCYQLGMNLTNLEAVRASPWFEILPKETEDSLIRMMSTTKGATRSSTLPIGDALEIPKSPWPLRPKKDP